MRRKVFKAFLILSALIAGLFMVTIIYYRYFWRPSYEVPFQATYLGQSDLLEKWLSDGGDPNSSEEGWPLLCIAVDSPKGNSRTVELLLQHGANPNATAEGFSAFILAARNTFSDIENMLLLASYGANIDCRNPNGTTPVEIRMGRNASPEHRRQVEKAFEQIRAIATQYQESRGAASHIEKAGE